jgi:hypothetical protein
MSRSAAIAILALIVAAGTWPWLGELPRWPMTPDAVTWIERAEVGPGWLEWTFLASHFEVGWRPLTALSFTANRLLAGLDPLLYRATDLALHALAAWLVAASARRLAPGLPRWAGWLAAALFLAHPVAEEVVPYLARRSYALATVLVLLALLVHQRPREPGARSGLGRGLAAGTLLALGIASNEAAVLACGALPLLARAQYGPRAPLLSPASVGLALPVLLVLALRTAVVGGIGGYEAGAAGAGQVLAAAWREIACLARAGEGLAWAALLALLPYYGWRALAGPGPLAVLALWVAAYPLLYAGQGVWFPRQAYPAAAPLALLVALAFAGTWSTRGGWARAAHLAPQVLFVGILLWSSPLLRGPDPARTAERRAAQAIIDGALAELGRPDASGDGSSAVHLVLPYSAQVERDGVLKAGAVERELSRTARLPARLLAMLLAERGVESRELAYVHDVGDRRQPLARLGEDRRTLIVREGCAYFVAREEPEGGGPDRAGRARLLRRGASDPRAVSVPPGSVWIAGGGR